MLINKNIILAHADLNPEKLLKKIGQSETRIHWLYLGRNYAKLIDWEKSLGISYQRIHYAELLQDIAFKLRPLYLTWISQLGKLYNRLSWWSSAIANKNTAVHSLYHEICYLHIVLFYEQNIKPPLLIIGESKFLLHQIALENKLKGRVKWICKPRLFFEYLDWTRKMFFVWTMSLVSAFFEIRDAKKTQKGFKNFPLVSEKTRVLIHSCIDETYFSYNKPPNDRFFTILPIELEKRGYDVVILPWLYNIKRTRLQALKWFRHYNEKYLIPYDYYNIFDYLWAAWIVIKQAWKPSGKQLFHNKDITLLVLGERLSQALNHEVSRLVLYYRLIEKWQKIGLKLDIFIDTFENLIGEKPQLIAFRKYMPNVKTVGFQHYISTYPLWLSMFTNDEEKDIIPHPDKIVCNSKFTAKIFADAGFPKNKLKVGPSLRYQSLMKYSLPNEKLNNNVLVILTIELPVIAESIHKIIEAFPYNEGINFYLKVHPMMSDTQWLSALGGKKLPTHMIKVDGVIDSWIARSTCAIVMLSTSCLEILLQGVPVVMLGRETDFDMNPLYWFPEFKGPVRNPNELRKKVLDIISNPQKARDDAKAFADKYRNDCLTPINENTISIFVENI